MCTSETAAGSMVAGTHHRQGHSCPQATRSLLHTNNKVLVAQKCHGHYTRAQRRHVWHTDFERATMSLNENDKMYVNASDNVADPNRPFTRGLAQTLHASDIFAERNREGCGRGVVKRTVRMQVGSTKWGNERSNKWDNKGGVTKNTVKKRWGNTWGTSGVTRGVKSGVASGVT